MKITKTWAKKALEAVNEIIERYKASEESGTSGKQCPLCKAFACSDCPWIIFEGDICEGYDKTPLPQRLPRLYGWHKRLTNIIERGK